MNFADALNEVSAGADAGEVAGRLVTEMTPDERINCLDGDGPFWTGLQYMTAGGYHRSPFFAAEVPRLGVPGFGFSDGPRGVVVDHATCFPVSMARGATWDPALEERVGDAIGQELRAVGATLYGGVCVNLLRHPAWGRAQETYGEDPFHVGEMGAALTRGVQRHAMACVKHFAANSMENARFKVDVTVDEAALHEVYLPHFKRIVDEGVASVMSAYNSVNGEWCGQSAALLNGVLRSEWGFGGFVISDWFFGLRDGVESVRAGLDIEMPYRMVRFRSVPAALASGELTEADVDACVVHVMATLLRFGSVLGAPAPPHDVLVNAEHRALAREVAARSVVLLRNERVGAAPLLPLDADAVSSLAVVGRLASEINLGDGGSSDVWSLEAVTIADAMVAALGADRVRVDDGSDPAAAASVAAACEVALVVVGYTFRDEGEFISDDWDMSALNDLFPDVDDPEYAAAFEARVAATANIQAPPHVKERSAVGFATGGDRTSIRLSDADVALIRAVSAANQRTIVAVVAGSAVVNSEWDSEVPAFVQSWYSGMEGGNGLVDVLFGAVDPSARLPFTVPGSEAHLPSFDRDAEAATYDRWHGWWLLERDGNAPAYPFGFGLGYTTFELGASTIEAGGDAGVAFTVTTSVRNTGGRDGADVVQVYARRDGSDRPRRLVGFARAEVAAGGEAAVTIEVPHSALAERDVARHVTTSPGGVYEVQAARHAADVTPSGRVEVAAQPAPSAGV